MRLSSTCALLFKSKNPCPSVLLHVPGVSVVFFQKLTLSLLVVLRVNGSRCPMLQEFKNLFPVVRLFQFQVSRVLGMDALSFGIQHHQHRETKTLRITKVGKDIGIFIFAAGIQQGKNIIGLQERINLCVFMYKLMKTYAPGSPIPSYLQQHMLALKLSLRNSFLDFSLCIQRRIINLRLLFLRMDSSNRKEEDDT